jgi:hypothetical protein
MAANPQPFPQNDEIATAAAPPELAAPASPLDLRLHVFGPKRAEDSPVPLWDGLVNVQRIADPAGKPIWDYRQLFVTREPLFGNVLLPGTIVVQATVLFIDTRIGAANASRWVPGSESKDLIVTLLLDCPPGDWVISGGAIVQSARCRCAAGEIRLGDFAQQPATDEWQRHFRSVLTFPTTLAPESFAVNSSGFSLVAQAKLPWLQSTKASDPPVLLPQAR